MEIEDFLLQKTPLQPYVARMSHKIWNSVYWNLNKINYTMVAAKKEGQLLYFFFFLSSMVHDKKKKNSRRRLGRESSALFWRCVRPRLNHVKAPILLCIVTVVVYRKGVAQTKQEDNLVFRPLVCWWFPHLGECREKKGARILEEMSSVYSLEQLPRLTPFSCAR